MRPVVRWIVAAILTALSWSPAVADDPPAPGYELLYRATRFWTDTEPVIEFQEREFFAMERLDDGRMAILGEEWIRLPDRFGLESRYLVVVSLAADGTEQWRRRLAIEEDPYGSRLMIASPDGGWFVCDGNNNYFRLDAAGEIVWHVHYDYWAQSTCFGMAYHPDGLLLVAGQAVAGPRPYDSEASLTAYDADDATIRWQTGYRPLDGSSGNPEDLNFRVTSSRVRTVPEGIEWSGQGTIWDGPSPTYFPWSLFVSPDGARLPPKSPDRFATEAAHLGAVLSDAPVSIRAIGSTSITLWRKDDWWKPWLQSLDAEALFGLSTTEYFIDGFSLDSRDDTLTVAFRRYGRPILQTHLDIVSRSRARPDALATKTLSLELPGPPGGFRIGIVWTATDEFSLWEPEPIFFLAEGPRNRWRIDRIEVDP